MHLAYSFQKQCKFRMSIKGRTYLHDEHGSYGLWMSPLNNKEHNCCQRNTMNQIRYISQLYTIIYIKKAIPQAYRW